MEQRASWFPVVAILLIVVGVVTLAAPPPAHAFDPQLALALASAAGAIALITGYLIVSNSRDKERSASFNSIYTCRGPESSGPMGCAGPTRPGQGGVSAMADGPMGADSRVAGRTAPMQTEGPMASFGPLPTAADAALQSAAAPMIADGRGASRTESLAGRGFACPGGQPAGPMGCDGPMAPASVHSTRASSASAPASMSSPYQGQ